MATESELNKGYVYVLSNPGMPGLLKIGRCIEGGRVRARQLYQTGVPYPFTVEFELLTDDPEWVEMSAHTRLAHLRVNGSREFFAVEAFEAERAVISAHIDQYDYQIVHADEATAITDLSFVAHQIDEHWIDVCNSVTYIDREAIREGVRKRKDVVSKRARRLSVVSSESCA